MKILITGGNGYIGSSLYKALKDKHNVTVVTRKDFDLTNYLQTFRWFRGKKFDVVIHTAVVGGHRGVIDDEGVATRNLLMYYNLLECKHHFNRFITFGSGAEFSDPNSPYGLSKRVIAESMSTKPDFYNLRIFAVFDENELDTRFIKANVKRYLNKENLEIYQNKYMDFFYMEDLISLVNYYITAEDPVKEVNCCYNSCFSLSEIIGFINELDEYKVDVVTHTTLVAPPYNGMYAPLLIPLIGLKEGIKRVYNKLKNG